jgi:hypothetical protein
MQKFVAHRVELNNGVKLKRINQMTDKKNRLLYTIITVVSVIVFTVYKM